MTDALDDDWRAEPEWRDELGKTEIMKWRRVEMRLINWEKGYSQ